MSHFTLYAGGLVLAVSVALSACGEAPELGKDSIGACASALSAKQGVSLQGISPQGFSPQGTRMQGTRMQGVSLQGTRLQGISPQGFSPQGTEQQGFSAQGTRLSESSLSGAASGARLELANGALELVLADGGVLRGTSLEGVELPFVTSEADTVWLEIAHAERAPESDSAWLYELQLEGQRLCGDDGLGVFVPGVWDDKGNRLSSLDAGGRVIDATFSCRAGVIAKCVSWGYEPWTAGADLHQACTRMARADYCGDGVPHTEDGTLIDMFDSAGIQTPVHAPAFSFEAGWGPDGATCVSQPRYLDLDAEGGIDLPECWDLKPRCDSWDKARSHGAQLGNDSAHALRSASCAGVAGPGATPD